MQKPTYRHDCDRCQYLGSVTGPDSFHQEIVKTWDLYFCPPVGETVLRGSVIARYGDEGSQYLSTDRAIRRNLTHGQPALRWADSIVEMREWHEDRRKQGLEP